MGSMEESATSPFMCGVEEPMRFHYDWGSEEALGSFIVQRMVECSGVSSTEIPEPLYGCIDPDALEELFQPLADGTARASGKLTFMFAGHYITASSDGTVEIESELGRLKRTGGNLLLTGDVPADLFEELSVQFLGAPSNDRTHLFALYGRDVDVARKRLSRANANPAQAHILTHEVAVRSATQAQSNAFPDRPSASSVEGSLDDFQTAIQDELLELQYGNRGFEPGELRFCLDSLQLLSNEEGSVAVERSLRKITETVEELSGIGQYIFPGAFDSDSVQAVEPLFDVTIELKLDPDGPKQRWHLHETSHTTTWFPL
ncbi:DUF7504 family protein [Haladaptatus sp.]|uniref:DUF7504 family protein n=1 Tax=Haladaptatus sp. TaxID=1973141 RepID=UPI003C67E448